MRREEGRSLTKTSKKAKELVILSSSLEFMQYSSVFAVYMNALEQRKNSIYTYSHKNSKVYGIIFLLDDIFRALYFVSVSGVTWFTAIADVGWESEFLMFFFISRK